MTGDGGGGAGKKRAKLTLVAVVLVLSRGLLLLVRGLLARGLSGNRVLDSVHCDDGFVFVCFYIRNLELDGSMWS